MEEDTEAEETEEVEEESEESSEESDEETEDEEEAEGEDEEGEEGEDEDEGDEESSDEEEGEEAKDSKKAKKDEEEEGEEGKGKGKAFEKAFAELAEKNAKLKEEKERIAKFATEVEAKASLYNRVATALKNGDVRDLRKLGVDMDTLVAKYLDEGDDPQANDPVADVRRELEALKKEREEQRRAQEAATMEQTRAQYLKDATGYLQSDADRWELINASGAFEAVVKEQARSWHEEGLKLELDEVADIIESRLLERARSLSKAKKVNGTFDAPSKVPKAAKSKPSKGKKTLTNKLSSEKPAKKKAKANYIENFDALLKNYNI